MNEQKRHNISGIQNSAITKQLNKQQTNKFVVDYLDKLNAGIASKSEKDLMKAIEALNKKFDLGTPISKN